MIPCPNFECLDFTQSGCERFPACEGCPKHYTCGSCSNQATLIDGRALPCDMIHLPEACRFCQSRQMPDFSPAASCTLCPARQGHPTN